MVAECTFLEKKISDNALYYEKKRLPFSYRKVSGWRLILFFISFKV